MNEHSEQTMISRIGHNQISVFVKNDPLWILQSADEGQILIRHQHMDRVIAKRDDKDRSVCICDNIIRNGKIRQLFQCTVPMKAENGVAIFIGNQKVSILFYP